MSITIETPTAEAIFAALRDVPDAEIERLRALLDARAQDANGAAETEAELVARKEHELAALLNEGLQSEAVPFTRELWIELLSSVDEEAKRKGIDAGLLDAFLKKSPEPEASVR